MKQDVKETVLRPPVERADPGAAPGPELDAIPPGEMPTVAFPKIGPRHTFAYQQGPVPEAEVETLGSHGEVSGDVSGVGDLLTLESRRGGGRVTARGSLSPDQVLAGRFKVVRPLAQGGMGEVYEAEDLELNEPVAIKTLRPEIACDACALERFRREIRLARKVTHPNVCRVFEVFHHRTNSEVGAQAAGGKVTFLTMELLRGETLYERLRRTGRLTTAEALPLVAQMVEALLAAHRVGVVHRDFKSLNVMLVADGTAGGRAVVTDFGLAHSTRAEESPAEIASATGELLGTPAYMAPEQLEGGEITAATDVYGLGVVMYEMVTGGWPFVVKRRHGVPPAPRAIVPELDPVWDGVILRCLECDPADRFASVADVIGVLKEEGMAAGNRVPAEKGRRRRRLTSGGRGHRPRRRLVFDPTGHRSAASRGSTRACSSRATSPPDRGSVARRLSW